MGKLPKDKIKVEEMDKCDMTGILCPNTARIAVLENQYSDVKECLHEVKDDIKWIRGHMALKKDVDNDMADMKGDVGDVRAIVIQNLLQGGMIAAVIVVMSKTGIL